MNASINNTLVAAANANGIPSQMFLAQAQQESGLNPNAYNSKSGATGLLQIMPANFASLGITNPTDPVQNANGGATLLAQYYAQFGNWPAALAAFDWGPSNVRNSIATYGGTWLSYAPSETQNYVASIMASSGQGYTASASLPLAAPEDTSAIATDFGAAPDVDVDGAEYPEMSLGTALLLGGLAVGAVLAFNALEDA